MGAEVRDALEATLSLGVIPLLMLWDSTTTCTNNINQWNTLTDLWLQSDWKPVVQDERYAPYTLINPINEFSLDEGHFTREMYRDAYSTVIKKLRDAGYSLLLSINGYHCGQYVDSFSYIGRDTGCRIGEDLLLADPKRNLATMCCGILLH